MVFATIFICGFVGWAAGGFDFSIQELVVVRKIDGETEVELGKHAPLAFTIIGLVGVLWSKFRYTLPE